MEEGAKQALLSVDSEYERHWIRRSVSLFEL